MLENKYGDPYGLELLAKINVAPFMTEVLRAHPGSSRTRILHEERFQPKAVRMPSVRNQVDKK